MTAPLSPMERARKLVLYLRAEGWRPPSGSPDAFEKAQEYFAKTIATAEDLEEFREALRKGGR